MCLSLTKCFLKIFWEWSASTLSTIVIHTYFCQKEKDFQSSEGWQLEWKKFVAPLKQKKNLYCVPRIEHLYFNILYSYHPPVQRSDCNGNERYSMRDLGFLWRSCCIYCFLLRLLPCRLLCMSPVSLVSAFLQSCISLPVKWCAVKLVCKVHVCQALV